MATIDEVAQLTPMQRRRLSWIPRELDAAKRAYQRRKSRRNAMRLTTAERDYYKWKHLLPERGEKDDE